MFLGLKLISYIMVYSTYIQMAVPITYEFTTEMKSIKASDDPTTFEHYKKCESKEELNALYKKQSKDNKLCEFIPAKSDKLIKPFMDVDGEKYYEDDPEYEGVSQKDGHEMLREALELCKKLFADYTGLYVSTRDPTKPRQDKNGKVYKKLSYVIYVNGVSITKPELRQLLGAYEKQYKWLDGSVYTKPLMCAIGGRKAGKGKVKKNGKWEEWKVDDNVIRDKYAPPELLDENLIQYNSKSKMNYIIQHTTDKFKRFKALSPPPSPTKSPKKAAKKAVEVDANREVIPLKTLEKLLQGLDVEDTYYHTNDNWTKFMMAIANQVSKDNKDRKVKALAIEFCERIGNSPNYSTQTAEECGDELDVRWEDFKKYSDGPVMGTLWWRLKEDNQELWRELYKGGSDEPVVANKIVEGYEVNKFYQQWFRCDCKDPTTCNECYCKQKPIFEKYHFYVASINRYVRLENSTDFTSTNEEMSKMVELKYYTDSDFMSANKGLGVKH